MRSESINTQTPNYTDGKSDEELIGHIGFGELVQIDEQTTKNVLIMGENSYIGNSFIEYAAKYYPALNIKAVSTFGDSWKSMNFSEYDIIFHLAGIAHSEVRTADDETKKKYYSVNTDLAVEVGKKAKDEGVKVFVFMSSMIIYGESSDIGKDRIIDITSIPKPANFYGDSKLQADIALRDLADNNFKVIILRPPMIYGKNSKGNYRKLSRFAKKTPIFPLIHNQRSMLFIGNFCEFLCQVMLIKTFNLDSVVLIPQNSKSVSTTELVSEISKVTYNRVWLVRGTKKIISSFVIFLPRDIRSLFNKMFGNYVYDLSISNYPGLNYQKYSFSDSIKMSES